MTCLCLLVVLCALLPSTTSGQERGTVVGVVVGPSRTRLLWRPPVETNDVVGIVVGAYAENTTPLGWLALQVEGAYAQRGGDVSTDPQGLPLEGRLRADYLSVGVSAKVAASLGPIRAHLLVGPSVDAVLRSRVDPQLAQVLDSDQTRVLSVTVGVGAGARVAGRVFAEVEARNVEGLGDAYSGGFTSARYRSTELVVRLGVPYGGPE
jgi:hypothetical protein